MRKTIYLTFLAFAATFVLAIAPSDREAHEAIEDNIELPDNIKKIVESKCIGCHKPDSRNEKAKKKLQWVNVPELDEEGQKDFIDEMFEVLEDGAMPPKKALEKRPEMKLTDEEVSELMAWLEEEEKKLK